MNFIKELKLQSLYIIYKSKKINVYGNRIMNELPHSIN